MPRRLYCQSRQPTFWNWWSRWARDPSRTSRKKFLALLAYATPWHFCYVLRNRTLDPQSLEVWKAFVHYVQFCFLAGLVFHRIAILFLQCLQVMQEEKDILQRPGHTGTNSSPHLRKYAWTVRNGTLFLSHVVVDTFAWRAAIGNRVWFFLAHNFHRCNEYLYIHFGYKKQNRTSKAACFYLNIYERNIRDHKFEMFKRGLSSA